MRSLAALTVAVALAGCRTPQAAGPREALARYLDAARAGRTGEAYAMLSSSWRRDHDEAELAALLGKEPDALAAAAAQLAAGAPVEERAEVRLGGDETVALVLEDGAWHLASDPLDLYPQSTPVEALRSFLRAVERRRWDVVIRFVPARYRRGLSVDKVRAMWEGPGGAELQAEAAEARKHLGDPIDVRGDEAVLPLGDKREIRIVREERAWRVESLR